MDQQETFLAQLRKLHEKQVETWASMVVTGSQNPRSLEYLPKHPYGAASKAVQSSLKVELVHLTNKLADIYNVALISGYRGKEEQTELHEANPIGALPWPSSLHNVYPSHAVDIVPYPVDWNDLARFDNMIGACMAIAKEGGYKIRSGKYFSNVADYPHIELVSG